MRNFSIAAALMALASCGANEATTAEDTAQTTGGDAAGQTASELAAEAIAGTYEVTSEDGAVVLQRVDAGGTYVETVAGTETERGTWHQKGDQMCYDPEGEPSEQCYTGGQPGPDGSFGVGTDGGAASVRRVDPTEANEAEPDSTDAP